MTLAAKRNVLILIFAALLLLSSASCRDSRLRENEINSHSNLNIFDNSGNISSQAPEVEELNNVPVSGHHTPIAPPQIAWQRCLGGSNYDEANSVQKTADNGYIIAADTNSTDGNVSGNHGNFDFWVVKLNDTGDIQWQKCLGGERV